MSRVFTTKIEGCTSCPFCSPDKNDVWWICKKFGRHLFIQDSEEDEQPIPDWCPLPKEEP